MLNTYIKNRGLSQTIMNNNNHSSFNELLWNADYDGNNANINVSSNNNGHKKRYNINLDNDDLSNMLNIPSVNMPIHKRLQMDFEQQVFRNEPRVLQIELPKMKTPEMKIPEIKTPEIIIKPRFLMKPESTIDNNTVSSLVEPSITSILESASPTSYLSSPLSNEELLVPITIDEKTLDNYRLTPKRRHRHKKTHKTYKVYKKQKSPKRSSPKHKSPKHKHKSKTSKGFTLF